MKTTVSLTLDVEVWNLAKKRYENVSKLINDTLKGLLDLPETTASTQNIKQTKESLAVSQAKTSELSIKLKKMEEKHQKEEENVTYL